MKMFCAVLGLAAICGTPAAFSQEMPGMPGMSMPMPMPAAPQPQPQKSQPKPRQPSTSKMLQLPGDMQHPTPTDPAARQESASERNSEAQQRPQADIKAGPGSDAGSLTRPTLTLQEPENPNFHTGSALPAPELLGEVAKRDPIGLAQWQAWAEEANPTLAEAQAAIARSRAQARQAGLAPNPTVGYSGEHIRGGEYGGGEEGAFVQQTVVLGGKLGLRRAIHDQEAAANTLSLQQQHFRVRNDLQQAFYSALTDQAEILVRQRLLKTTLDAVETAHLLSNLGQADAPDVLEAEVEAEQAKMEYVEAQRLYLGDLAVLAAYAGRPDQPPAPLTGDLEHAPELEPQQQVEQIVSSSPSVQQAESLVTVAQARAKDAKREPIPDLHITAGEWYSGEQIESAHKPAGWMGFAQVGVDLPLWNRNQGNTEAARAEVARAQAGVQRLRLSLRQMAEPEAQAYLTSRFEAGRYRDQMIPRARRAYELYQMKYAQMAAAYPQVLVSQRTLCQLQIRYLEALRQEWSHAISLQNYVLRGGLDEPMTTGSPETTANLPAGR